MRFPVILRRGKVQQGPLHHIVLNINDGMVDLSHRDDASVPEHLQRFEEGISDLYMKRYTSQNNMYMSVLCENLS